MTSFDEIARQSRYSVNDQDTSADARKRAHKHEVALQKKQKMEEMRVEEANRAFRARQEEAEELKRQEAERSRQREMAGGWNTKPVTAPESETKQEPSVKAPVEVAAKPEVKKAATWKKVTPQRVRSLKEIQEEEVSEEEGCEG